MIYIESVYLISVLFTVIGLGCVSKMSMEQLRFINRNIGYAGLAGIVLVIIVSVLNRIINKNKDHLKTADRLLGGFLLLVLAAIQIFTMYSYVEISEKDIPVVTKKENVIVSAEKEYCIDDFIQVDNSHGEEFAKVVWNTGSREDSGGIELNEDRRSFTIHESKGELKITIWVHHSHYSDIEPVYLTAETNGQDSDR